MSPCTSPILSESSHSPTSFGSRGSQPPTEHPRFETDNAVDKVMTTDNSPSDPVSPVETNGAGGNRALEDDDVDDETSDDDDEGHEKRNPCDDEDNDEEEDDDDDGDDD